MKEVGKMLYEDNNGVVLIEEEFRSLPNEERWKFRKILFNEFSPLTDEVI
jgi:hypothetical protein